MSDWRKKDNESSLWTAVGVVLCIPFVLILTLIAIPALIWNGYVLKVLWSWFVVPAFSVRPLSLVTATGLVLIVHFLAYQPETAKTESKPAWMLLAMGFLGPAITLFVAWIIHHFLH